MVGGGILLADEGRDVGVDDFGVVELDLEAPATGKGELIVALILHGKLHAIFLFEAVLK